MSKVSKIELWAHETVNGLSGTFCAIFYLNGNHDSAARVDVDSNAFNVTFNSTIESRLAGLDYLLHRLTLSKLLAHKKTKRY